METSLKELRLKNNMTQKEVSERFGISLRSYKSYENEIEKQNTVKYKFMFNDLSDLCKVDEEHGLLSEEDIREACRNVLSKYKIDSCILFGSYAKGKANEYSDVDLLVLGKIRGLKFFGMVEELRNELHKNVDVLGMEQLKDNQELLREILKDGVRVYG